MLMIREIIREKSFQQKAIYNMYNNLRIAKKLFDTLVETS
jgi:hypothetical protein